jgi:hypothetical protein
MQHQMYWVLCYYCDRKTDLQYIELLRGLFVCCNECKSNGVYELED